MSKRGYIMQFVFMAVFLIIYGLLVYYIGIRGFHSINAQIPINKIAFWAIVVFLASAYIISMAGRNNLPEGAARFFSTIGGYWIAGFVYLLSFVIIFDIFGFLARRLNALPAVIRDNTWFIAFCVIAAVAILLAVGTYNAVVPRIREYNVAIDKKAGNLKSLKCAMISDIHLGEIIGRDRLRTAVEMINSMEPDLVVIAGDLFDGAVKPVKNQNMLKELEGIKSKYGTYAVMGNHEHYANAIDEITELLEASGVTVLRDKKVKIADSFYLLGREDMDGKRFGYDRTALVEILKDADTSLPVIVLDHQPSGLAEPREAGVDLQLSGHTHGGQFFPANLVTNMMFEEDYGYFRDGSFNLVVSCGYGTWGPTVRIGSQSEVVRLNIEFLRK